MFDKLKLSLQQQFNYPQIIWTLTWILFSFCIGFGAGQIKSIF